MTVVITGNVSNKTEVGCEGGLCLACCVQLTSCHWQMACSTGSCHCWQLHIDARLFEFPLPLIAPRAARCCLYGGGLTAKRCIAVAGFRQLVWSLC